MTAPSAAGRIPRPPQPREDSPSVFDRRPELRTFPSIGAVLHSARTEAS